MAAYYNEIDPYAAQWLRNLIAAGHIAPGDVDERSIKDVLPEDLKPYSQCHFFAGIGVWSYALRQAGWSDDRPVWTGSCPCQPFSVIGQRRGEEDERHLWPEFNRLISECKPPVVFGEQVASKDGLAWLDLVLPQLEASGYAAAAFDLCAAGVGSPHIRQRLYWVGDADYTGLEGHAWDGDKLWGSPEAGSTAKAGGPVGGFWGGADWLDFRDGKKRPVEPGLSPMAGRTASHMGRLRAYGNAIVGPLGAEFIKSYMEA